MAIINHSGTPLYIKGYLACSSDISLFVHGYIQETGSISLYTSGAYVSEGGIPLYLHAYSYITPEMSGSIQQASGSLNLYLEAGVRDNITLHTHGFDRSSGNIPLFINASVAQTDSTDLYVSGIGLSSNYVKLYVRGA